VEKGKSRLERENRGLQSGLHRGIEALRGSFGGMKAHELELKARKARGARRESASA
jgi:hypothetical protein